MGLNNKETNYCNCCAISGSFSFATTPLNPLLHRLVEIWATQSAVERVTRTIKLVSVTEVGRGWSEWRWSISNSDTQRTVDILSFARLSARLAIELTSIHPWACFLGLRKKVPSTRGYRSNTSIGSSHSTHATRLFCWDASEDKMNRRVSSLPWLPSSSIWKWKKREKRLKSYSWHRMQREEIF